MGRHPKAQELPDGNKVAAILKAAQAPDTPKDCPRCKVPPIVTMDKWRNSRCFCRECNMRESMAFPDDAQAIKAWNDSIK